MNIREWQFNWREGRIRRRDVISFCVIGETILPCVAAFRTIYVYVSCVNLGLAFCKKQKISIYYLFWVPCLTDVQSLGSHCGFSSPFQMYFIHVSLKSSSLPSSLIWIPTVATLEPGSFWYLVMLPGCSLCCELYCHLCVTVETLSLIKYNV